MDPQQAVLIVFGIVACFMGYSMFRTMLPLWGFVLGGWIAFILLPTILPAKAGDLVVQLIAAVVGGLIGAAIAIPLYFVIIFISGAVLGMIFGIMLGALIDLGGISTAAQLSAFTNMSFPPIPHTATQFVLMAIVGLIMGGISINFQKFMICASSAFMGAGAIVTGLVGPITQISSSDMGRGAFMLIGWMFLGMAGLFIQFRMMGEV